MNDGFERLVRGSCINFQNVEIHELVAFLITGYAFRAPSTKEHRTPIANSTNALSTVPPLPGIALLIVCGGGESLMQS